MKGIIIYKSKYGATRQYAEWLSNNLLIPFTTPEELKDNTLASYDYIVIGSSVYIGTLKIKTWLKSNAAILGNKKIFLFVVSGTPPNEKEKLDAIIKNNIPAMLIKKCTVYYLHGRMIMKNLSFRDRFLVKMGARLQKDPIEAKKMLQDFDDVKEEYIIPLKRDINAYRVGATRVVMEAK